MLAILSLIILAQRERINICKKLYVFTQQLLDILLMGLPTYLSRLEKRLYQIKTILLKMFEDPKFNSLKNPALITLNDACDSVQKIKDFQP
jgi:hypothetical protein